MVEPVSVRFQSKENAFHSLMLSAATIVSPLSALAMPDVLTQAQGIEHQAMVSETFGARDWLNNQPELTTWDAETTRSKVIEYLQSISAEPDMSQAVLAKLSDDVTSSVDQINSLAQILSTTDPRARALCEAMRSQASSPPIVEALPEASFLKDAEVPMLLATVMRQHYGDWLIKNQLFEQAYEVLQDVSTENTPDPKQLLFNQLVT